MALETLEGIQTINGERIMHLYGADPEHANHALIERDGGMRESVTWEAYDNIRREYPICIDHVNNSISHKIQNGPIKEVGKNGCQVTDMVATSKIIYYKLNHKHPCPENVITISGLEVALNAQALRTQNRELRGVEGYNKD